MKLYFYAHSGGIAITVAFSLENAVDKFSRKFGRSSEMVTETTYQLKTFKFDFIL